MKRRGAAEKSCVVSMFTLVNSFVAGKKILRYALEFSILRSYIKDDEIDEALAAVIQAVQLRCQERYEVKARV